MLNLRGRCVILKSSWSGGLSGSCCSGAFDTTPNNSESNNPESIQFRFMVAEIVGSVGCSFVAVLAFLRSSAAAS
jgi:hypothetical protein